MAVDKTTKNSSKQINRWSSKNSLFTKTKRFICKKKYKSKTKCKSQLRLERLKYNN